MCACAYLFFRNLYFFLFFFFFFTNGAAQGYPYVTFSYWSEYKIMNFVV